MTGEERRSEILKKLMEAQQPMSGTALAKAFQVSRQVIVQDIALMRAERHDILSTNKGYLYHDERTENTCPKRVFHVKHATEQVLDEFLTVTELGGRVLDVAVDLRKESPTFGRYEAMELSEENHRQMFIPRGFAHGFSVLSEEVIFQYKCDNYYAPQSEGAVAWDDPDLDIDWKIPAEKVLLSEKDKKHPRLKDILGEL